MEAEDEILTTEEAAKYLKVSAQTVRRLDLPRVQVSGIVRYRKSDSLAWFDRIKTEGGCAGAIG